MYIHLEIEDAGCLNIPALPLCGVGVLRFIYPDNMLGQLISG